MERTIAWSCELSECEYVNDEKAWEDKADNVKKYASELLEESSKVLKLANVV